MCPLSIIVHLVCSYLSIRVSKVQHPPLRAGLHGSHLHVLELVTDIKSLPPGVILHLELTALQGTVRPVKTLLPNHFQQQLAMFIPYHFGCIKLAVVRASSAPISSDERYVLTCNDTIENKDTRSA